jgi:hypothetical protein
MPSPVKSLNIKRYIALCGGDVRDALEKQLLASQALVDAAQVRLDQAVASLEKATAQVVHTSHSVINCEKEFRAIRQNPDVKRVRISKNTIVVDTRPITIRYKDSNYKMGTYRIIILTNVRYRNSIRELFEIRSIKGSGHPHVSDGVPCFGNVSESIAQLMKSKKYPAVIAVCIQFLKSYTDSANHVPYTKIHNWATGALSKQVHDSDWGYY